MKRNILAIVCLSMMILLSACQPTPEKPVVRQKEQRNMLEQAEAESGGDSRALSEMVSPPAHYTFSKDGEKGTVFIRADAAVSLPDAPGMHIYRVHPAQFTQQQVTAVYDELCGDSPMIEPPEELTKSEIEAMIVNMQERLSDPETPEDEKQWMKDDMKYWEKELPNAPESIPEVPVDSTLKEYEIKDYSQVVSEDGAPPDDDAMKAAPVVARYMGVNAMERLDNPDPMEFNGKTFYVSNDSDLEEAIITQQKDESGQVISEGGMTVNRRASIWFMNNTNGAAYCNYGQKPESEILVDEGFTLDETAKKFIAMTPAEAKGVVEDFLAKVGAEYMTVAEMYLTNDENFGNYDGLVGPAEHYAYRITCRRNLGGIPCAAIMGSSSTGEDGWGDSWDYENLTFMVNDDGIFQLDWYAPITVEEELVAENATLLPFEDISAAFEQQIWIQYAPYEDYNDENYQSKTTLTVEKVVLEYQRIMEQDNIENGFMTPVWNFYGAIRTESSYQDPETGEIYEDDYTQRDVLMTINAVDGTMIDRWKGY